VGTDEASNLGGEGREARSMGTADQVPAVPAAGGAAQDHQLLVPGWRWRRCSSRLAGTSSKAVDRRFNRRNYNAARTVEAFAVRLRNQVDLDSLSAELVVVVDNTMQPTAVSLWLRPSAQAPSRIQGRAS
jgi:hypothetical protein